MNIHPSTTRPAGEIIRLARPHRRGQKTRRIVRQGRITKFTVWELSEAVSAATKKTIFVLFVAEYHPQTRTATAYLSQRTFSSIDEAIVFIRTIKRPCEPPGKYV